MCSTQFSDFAMHDTNGTTSPGPAAYLLPSTFGFYGHDPSNNRSPQYSMGHKNESDKDLVPGTLYNLGNMTQHGSSNIHSHFFVSRHPESVRSNSPGPASYNMDDHEHHQSYAMGTKRPECSRSPSPAPNQYYLPSSIGHSVPNKTTNASFTMVGSHIIPTTWLSPGPAAYEDTSSDIYKLEAPHYSMIGQHHIKYCETSPGPAAYYPKLVDNSPSFTFGQKTGQIPYMTELDI